MNRNCIQTRDDRHDSRSYYGCSCSNCGGAFRRIGLNSRDTVVISAAAGGIEVLQYSMQLLRGDSDWNSK